MNINIKGRYLLLAAILFGVFISYYDWIVDAFAAVYLIGEYNGNQFCFVFVSSIILCLPLVWGLMQTIFWRFGKLLDEDCNRIYDSTNRTSTFFKKEYKISWDGVVIKFSNHRLLWPGGYIVYFVWWVLNLADKFLSLGTYKK